MICANCARQIDAGTTRCPACAGDPRLAGRYRLDRLLSSQTGARRYRGTRTDDGMLVRASALELHWSGGEPTRALDAALARLSALDHPALPRLIDYHPGPGPDASSPTLWLIHEHVPGKTLAELLDADPRLLREPAWLLVLIERAADGLAHLHEQVPPLVHGQLSLDSVLVHGDAVALLDLDPRLDTDAPVEIATDVQALGRIVARLLDPEQPSPLPAELADLIERARTPGQTSAAALRDAAAALTQAPPATRSPPTFQRPSQPAPRFMMAEPSEPAPPRPPAAQSASRSARRVTARSSTQRSDDIPVMRPEDLSRELSQAYRATTALQQRQRKQLTFARVLVVLVAATIAAMGTYLAMHL